MKSRGPLQNSTDPYFKIHVILNISIIFIPGNIRGRLSPRPVTQGALGLRAPGYYHCGSVEPYLMTYSVQTVGVSKVFSSQLGAVSQYPITFSFFSLVFLYPNNYHTSLDSQRSILYNDLKYVNMCI